MGGTLLLADDSITIQKVVELTFAETDHRVFAVSNGRELLRRLGEFSPDVILCDVVMPDISGYDVCQTLKSDPTTLHLPVILLTGTFEPFDRDRALAAGCDAIITKPFDGRELINVVEELMHRSRKAAAAPLDAETDMLANVGIPDGVPSVDFTTTGFDRMVPSGMPAQSIEPEGGLELTGKGFADSGSHHAPPPPPPELQEPIASTIPAPPEPLVEEQALPLQPPPQEMIEPPPPPVFFPPASILGAPAMIEDDGAWLNELEDKAALETPTPTLSLPPIPPAPSYEVEPEESAFATPELQAIPQPANEVPSFAQPLQEAMTPQEDFPQVSYTFGAEVNEPVFEAQTPSHTPLPETISAPPPQNFPNEISTTYPPPSFGAGMPNASFGNSEPEPLASEAFASQPPDEEPPVESYSDQLEPMAPMSTAFAPQEEHYGEGQETFAPGSLSMLGEEPTFAPMVEQLAEPQGAFAPVIEPMVREEQAFAPLAEHFGKPEVAFAPVSEAVVAKEQAFAPPEEYFGEPEVAFAPAPESLVNEEPTFGEAPQMTFDEPPALPEAKTPAVATPPPAFTVQPTPFATEPHSIIRDHNEPVAHTFEPETPPEPLAMSPAPESVAGDIADTLKSGGIVQPTMTEDGMDAIVRRVLEHLQPQPQHAGATEVQAGPSGLSDEDVERIAQRVLEHATPIIERIAWEVIPDMAELLVRRRIAELETTAEAGT